MKLLTISILLFAGVNAFGQKTFDIKNASKFFDVRLMVAQCDDLWCSGKATFSFYKKGGSVAYQTINLPDTQIQLEENGQPLTNVTMLYDKQSVIDVDDYNFDGMEDVAICDGANGSYGGPSYRIYLSSKAAKKFIYNTAFTKLGNHLGMFTVDKKKKTLETFDKSGCCWHITERYDVVGGKPRKIYEMVEEVMMSDPTKVMVSTKTLVKGKWKTSVKYTKLEQ
jgi:hypothetical protein